MAVVSMSNLLEAGVHFGHQTKRWNPKMGEYIFGTREDIYIIDLEKTNALIEEAYNALKAITENGGKVLFVGTKKQAQEVVVEEALRSKSYYVTERWLGGTLTNFRTIRRRVKRLEEIENMEKEGTFDKLPKKEVIGLQKEHEKLNRVLCGIREMYKLPQALVIVDPKKEYNAILEARKLKIPVFGLIDTNADPDLLDYVIPGNDDAVKSIKVVFGVLNNAICEATNLEMVNYVNEEDSAKEVAKKVEKTETVKKEEVKVEEKTETVKEDLNDKTLAELKSLAKDAGVKGYSSMKKDELITELNK